MFGSMFTQEHVDAVRAGEIGVMPTDTIYGLAASVDFPESIERLYRLRGRDTGKPFIILIADASDLERFEITLTLWQEEQLARLWPGRVSVVLPCASERLAYLHRGKQSLAFRVPDDAAVREFLHATGPVVSSSVNPEGLPPAATITDAFNYFGDDVDFVVDAGRLESKPSTVVSLEGDEVRVLRQGAVKIE